MKIAILQHVAFESAVMIADWAETHGHSVTICALYESALLPQIDAFEMLVIMGGPMSVGDDAKHPWLAPEKALIKAAIEADIVPDVNDARCLAAVARRAAQIVVQVFQHGDNRGEALVNGVGKRQNLEGDYVFTKRNYVSI